MKHLFLLLILLFALMPNFLRAQEEPQYETYDLIYMKDGRGILKGEILVFDEEDGHIVFLDTEGRKYTIARYEYDYFIEDKVVIVNEGTTLVLNPRKNNEIEVSVGLIGGYINLDQTVTPDDLYIDGNTGLGFLPVSFKLSIGKFLDRQNFVGLTADIGLLGEAKTYFNGGLRYVHQYKNYKRNVAFYLPLELQYGNLTSLVNYSTTDTNFTDGGYSYPTYKDIEMSIQSIGLHVGQGVAFILPDKKSIKIELTIVKNFVLGYKALNTNAPTPSATFNQAGIRLGVLYSL
jgi:hypothetical protein